MLPVLLTAHFSDCSVTLNYSVIFYSFSTAVAIQCLETTFKISPSDCHLAVPQPLGEIFLNALLKVGTANHTVSGVMLDVFNYTFPGLSKTVFCHCYINRIGGSSISNRMTT